MLRSKECMPTERRLVRAHGCLQELQSNLVPVADVIGPQEISVASRPGSQTSISPRLDCLTSLISWASSLQLSPFELHFGPADGDNGLTSQKRGSPFVTPVSRLAEQTPKDGHLAGKGAMSATIFDSSFR